jgi:hypothetical protein
LIVFETSTWLVFVASGGAAGGAGGILVCAGVAAVGCERDGDAVTCAAVPADEGAVAVEADVPAELVGVDVGDDSGSAALEPSVVLGDSCGAWCGPWWRRCCACASRPATRSRAEAAVEAVNDAVPVRALVQ